jgi:hypothetical protein
VSPRGCKVCTGVEPRTVNRLLGVGYGIRFVAKRFPHLNRKEVKRHQQECFPGMRDEVAQDLVRLGER